VALQSALRAPCNGLVKMFNRSILNSLGAAGVFAAAAAFCAGAASAAVYTATIDGISVSDYGAVDPATAPVAPQSAPDSVSANGAVFVLTGQSNWTSVPSGLSWGWDPYGASDTTHQWINIDTSDTTAVYNTSGSTLKIVWGSPNAAPYWGVGSLEGANDNVVTFFDASGAVIGQVGDLDIYNAFNSVTPVLNDSSPGNVIAFQTPQPFASVAFSTRSSSFEFANAAGSAVPEVSTWAMLGLGFAGLGAAGWRSRRVTPRALD